MSITFWLVRHGLKESFCGDVPLTAEGRSQARATAAFLKERSIAAIATSPLRRAVETSGFLSREAGLQALEDRRLRERANWGDIPGQTFEEFAAVWEQCTREPDHIPPSGGDSARQAARRMDEALREWASRYPPGSEIVFFTHGGLITDFLTLMLEPDEWNTVHPDFVAAQSLLIPECSVTELIVEKETYRLGTFADTRHLTRLLP
ncbi:histidine phosphatase family protein [Saccharibacillus sacchari]|uniref:Histidine phosphatase family protein n=1 Tax=Saccharibacillus sacchari TaxID=456493 RepID=A0ACC6PGR3_9BACL